MPELTKGMVDQKLADIFAWLRRGELALPELQRPSVWSDSKIPPLLESVYLDYPFGIMLIWTPEVGIQIVCRQFEFEEERGSDEEQVPQHFLIDGQQRLTSFYRSLHEDINPPRDWTIHVAFNVIDEEFSLIDAQIKSILASPREYGWCRLRELLAMEPDSSGLAQIRKEQNQIDLDRSMFNTIFGPSGRLWRLLPQNISVGIYNIKDRNYSDVVEIFERINQGTPVKESQIILGKLSQFYHGIVANVESYLSKSRAKHGRGFDLDFFMATLAVVARGFNEIAVLPNYYENEHDDTDDSRSELVQLDIERTKAAIDRAMLFVDDYLYMDTFKYIRSPRTMTCLVYLLEKFPACRKKGEAASRAAYWVAQAILIRYHGDQKRLKWDIATIREDVELPFDRFKANLRRQRVKTQIKDAYDQLDNDLEYPISRSNPLFGFLYALLRSNKALSFPSMRPIRAIRVEQLRDDEAEELEDVEPGSAGAPILQEHHVYPAARLRNELDTSEDEWFEKAWIHDIANITFILGDDNFGTGDSAIEYLDNVNGEIKSQHMIGSKRYRTGDFKSFLIDRRLLIKKGLMDYFEHLRLVAGE